MHLPVRRISPIVSVLNVQYVLLKILLMPVNVSLRQQGADLEDRNDRQKPYEQKDQRKEEPDRADEHRPVEDRRAVHGPRRRQKVTVQTGHNNYESFQPHTDADDDRDHEKPERTLTETLEP